MECFEARVHYFIENFCFSLFFRQISYTIHDVNYIQGLESLQKKTRRFIIPNQII